jgi:hypothetical protein
MTTSGGRTLACPHLLGGLVVLATGLIFVFIALPALARERRYHVEGREVDAMVLVKQLSHATSNTSTVHRITYRVAIEGLPAVEHSEPVDIVLWDQAAVGELLRARYLPNSPDSVRLLPAPSVRSFVVLAVVGGLVSAIGAALVVSATRGMLRA